MLYQVPLSLSGNQRDRLITPGAAPMDCPRPFRPHSSENAIIMTKPGRLKAISRYPSRARMRLMPEDIRRPNAMKRRMLQ